MHRLRTAAGLVTATELAVGYRAYTPKIATLDRSLDQLVSDRKAIYARQRVMKGKIIFPGQVLEKPKEPTPLVERMELEREHKAQCPPHRLRIWKIGWVL